MTEKQAAPDRGDVQAVGAALTGTVLYALPLLLAYWAAYQVNLALAALVVVLAFVELRVEVLHNIVGENVQPHVNRLWGVSREASDD